MKKVISLLLALILSVGCFGVFANAESALPFEDVKENRWSYEFILTLFDAGIINGRSDISFAPADNVTRAEFVKMLGGISAVDPTQYSTTQFTDVKKKAWYAGYVAWAVEAGVTTGMSEDTFAPDAKITREQMATMIYRYADNRGIALPDSKPIITFADTADIAPYAKTAVREMQQADIINGIRDDSTGAYRFEPKANATREHAAKMLCVLFDHITSTRRLEAFAMLHQYIEDNAGGTSSVVKNAPAYITEIENGTALSGATYVMYLELFYDSDHDEIGITHHYEDTKGVEIFTTLCLPRESGEQCYYKFDYYGDGQLLIGAVGCENSAKLGRGDHEFKLNNLIGYYKNDAAAVKNCEHTFIQYLFNAVNFMSESILPTATPNFSARDLGFNI